MPSDAMLPNSNEVPPPIETTTGVLADDWPSLDTVRLRYIHRAIAHTKNNKTRAAALLGIDRRTLNRILARERARQGLDA